MKEIENLRSSARTSGGGSGGSGVSAVNNSGVGQVPLVTNPGGNGSPAILQELTAGSGVTLTSDGNQVTIASSGGGNVYTNASLNTNTVIVGLGGDQVTNTLITIDPIGNVDNIISINGLAIDEYVNNIGSLGSNQVIIGETNNQISASNLQVNGNDLSGLTSFNSSAVVVANIVQSAGTLPAGTLVIGADNMNVNASIIACDTVANVSLINTLNCDGVTNLQTNSQVTSLIGASSFAGGVLTFNAENNTVLSCYITSTPISTNASFNLQGQGNSLLSCQSVNDSDNGPGYYSLTGNNNALIACYSYDNFPVNGFQIGGQNNTAISCGAIQSSIVQFNNTFSTMFSCVNCISNIDYSCVMNSTQVQNVDEFSFVMGTGDQTDPPLTSNRTIQLEATTGDILIAGTLTQNNVFSDVAEAMPNYDQTQAIPVGTLVSLHPADYEKIRIAQDLDEILGVISAHAGLIMGTQELSHSSKYQYDEFGARLTETIKNPYWVKSKGKTEKDRPMMTKYKSSSTYNKSLDKIYIPRLQRPKEWSVVGLLGKVHVRVGDKVVPGDYLKPQNGIGLASRKKSNLRVLKISQEFDPQKGYAIAICIIR
jgi:hypothetical protein